MCRSSSTFMKGVGIGAVASLTAIVIGRTAMKKSKSFTKRTSKTMKAMSNIMDDLHSLIG